MQSRARREPLQRPESRATLVVRRRRSEARSTPVPAYQRSVPLCQRANARSRERISVPHVPASDLSALPLALHASPARPAVGRLVRSLQRSSPPGWHAGAVSRQDETSVAQARHCSHEAASCAASAPVIERRDSHCPLPASPVDRGPWAIGHRPCMHSQPAQVSTHPIRRRQGDEKRGRCTYGMALRHPELKFLPCGPVPCLFDRLVLACTTGDWALPALAGRARAGSRWLGLAGLAGLGWQMRTGWRAGTMG